MIYIREHDRPVFIIAIIGAILYCLMTTYVVYDTTQQYQQYGWYYSVPQITTFTVDTRANIVVAGILFYTAVTFIVCTRSFVSTYDYKNSGDVGIEFPKGEPEYWDVGYVPETNCLEVTIDDIRIVISSKTIEELKSHAR